MQRKLNFGSISAVSYLDNCTLSKEENTIHLGESGN